MKEWVAIIMGYGIPDEIIEDGNYNDYLEESLAQIDILKIKTIILCGGRTNPKYPFKSEAGEMERLIHHLRPKNDYRILKVGTSITSEDNLIHSRLVILKNDLSPDSIIVFCEYTRTAKTMIHAAHFLTYQIPFIVKGINFDATRNMRKDISQYIAAVLAFGSYMFHRLTNNH